jgi:hypothetical protein
MCSVVLPIFSQKPTRNFFFSDLERLPICFAVLIIILIFLRVTSKHYERCTMTGGDLIFLAVKIKQADTEVFGRKCRVPRVTYYPVIKIIGQRKDIAPRVTFDVPNTRESVIGAHLQRVMPRGRDRHACAFSFDDVDRFLIRAAFMNEFSWHPDVTYFVRRILVQQKRELVEPRDSSIIRFIRLHFVRYCKVLVGQINFAVLAHNHRHLRQFVVCRVSSERNFVDLRYDLFHFQVVHNRHFTIKRMNN